MTLNANELSELRRHLIERRAELMAEGDLAFEPLRADGTTDKVDDDASPLTEMNQVIASKRNKNRALELERIDAAIKRLDADPEGFGECGDCEEPIPIGRLRLMPWTQFCVTCQEKRSPPRDGRRRHLGDYD